MGERWPPRTSGTLGFLSPLAQRMLDVVYDPWEWHQAGSRETEGKSGALHNSCLVSKFLSEFNIKKFGVRVLVQITDSATPSLEFALCLYLLNRVTSTLQNSPKKSSYILSHPGPTLR